MILLPFRDAHITGYRHSFIYANGVKTIGNDLLSSEWKEEGLEITISIYYLFTIFTAGDVKNMSLIN